MNVLFFSHQASYLYGGEIVTLEFMRELRAQGVSVHFASPAGPYQERARATGARVHAVSSRQFSRKLAQLPGIARSLVSSGGELRRLVREHEIHVLHATSLKAMAYAWSVAGSAPVLWHHHDILPAGAANALWVQGLAARAARILAPSEATRRSLIEAGVPAGKAFVLRNGFRVPEWPARGPRVGGPFRVGVVGEISPRKGTDRLEKILQELGDQQGGSERIELVVIGERLSDPDFAARVKQRLATYPVRFLGRQENMKERYRELDALLVPSRQDPLPTVIVEAGLSGLPIVGARAGGIPEMITHGENGFLFDTEAEAARELLRVRDSWASLAKASRALAERSYDVAALTQELVKHYGEIVVGKP